MESLQNNPRDTQLRQVPPSGGSLEIGKLLSLTELGDRDALAVPPSGGSLEIGKQDHNLTYK